jgi:hypothetical protein
MNSWAIENLNLKPHAPEILASTDDARAIALLIPAGESLDDHQVHPCSPRPHRCPTLAAAHAMARTRPSRSDDT